MIKSIFSLFLKCKAMVMRVFSSLCYLAFKILFRTCTTHNDPWTFKLISYYQSPLTNICDSLYIVHTERIRDIVMCVAVWNRLHLILVDRHVYWIVKDTSK